ncbi:MAG: pentapeptide repeat-containing protein [Methanosarcinaceae archaeon]|nr:pentapeptide repeat-containing protein [Methanosarcinaceae archaeon]
MDLENTDFDNSRTQGCDFVNINLMYVDFE